MLTFFNLITQILKRDYTDCGAPQPNGTPRGVSHCGSRGTFFFGVLLWGETPHRPEPFVVRGWCAGKWGFPARGAFGKNLCNLIIICVIIHNKENQ